MTISSNVPSFTQWNYNATLFLNDSPGSEWTLWDFVWDGKSYSNAEDIFEEGNENPEKVEDMGEWLNTNGIPHEIRNAFQISISG